MSLSLLVDCSGIYASEQFQQQQPLVINCLYKPNGASAKDIDRVMLQNLWAHHINMQNSPSEKKMIFAGIGRPSYLLDKNIALAASKYWQDRLNAIMRAEKLLTQTADLSNKQGIAIIAQANTAIDYGNPAGDSKFREVMAKALSNWYRNKISADDILFTVGGAGALRVIFRLIHAQNPCGRIVTQSPYYTFYNNPDHNNHLHFIDVMNEPGYRLTAKALEKSIQEANQLAKVDGRHISAFLFCDPNNPIGSVIGEQEWKKIVTVLKTTPDHIPIIIDEAYAEMTFNGKHVSILTIAPELKNRLIILRSATKALSASGERMAVILCFSQEWREGIINELILAFLHLPKSLQYAYAQGMLNFSEEKRKGLCDYYQLQVEFVQKRLFQMKAALPDYSYKVEGTFYVLADLSALLGSPIESSAARALGREGTITTDEEICYSLLFQEHVMLSPLSYYGTDPKKGFVRITCSGGLVELTELMDRIEQRLKEVKLKTRVI